VTTTLERRLAVVRALVGAYAAVWLAIRLPHHLDLAALPAARWEPVGVLAPLDAPPPAALARAVAVVAIPAAAALAAGWRLRLTAPLCLVTLLAVTTYASSWGQLFHTENLLVLHVAVLAAAAVCGRRVDARLALQLLAVVTAAAYVASGIAKLRGAGWAWAAGDVLRDQVAFDHVRKAVLGAPTSPLGIALVDHAWVFTPLALATLAVELGAPVALAGRRLAAGWAAAAWAFHVGVLALMAIGFPYQLTGVAFAALLPVERLVPFVRRGAPARRPRPPHRGRRRRRRAAATERAAGAHPDRLHGPRPARPGRLRPP
jgi:hypothetical protein